MKENSSIWDLLAHQQCQLAAVCRDGRALGQDVVQDHPGSDLVAAQNSCAAHQNAPK